MGRGKRSRKNHRQKRAAARRAAFPLQRHSSKKNVAINDQAYKQLASTNMKELKDYIHGNNLHESKFGLKLIRPKNCPPVITVSPSLMMSDKQAKNVTRICPSEHGLNLTQRSAVGLGLGQDESFEVRWKDVDGQLIAIMNRNVFTPLEARASDLFEAEHKQFSLGWNRGCEADVISRENTTRRQLKNKKTIIDATGINANNKFIEVHPGGIGETTRIKVEYQNQKGKAKEVPLSSFIDRMTWVKKGGGRKKRDYSKFCNDSDDAAASYFDKLQSHYLDACAQFMGEDEFNKCSDDVKANILLNTNVLDDDLSKMGIHHDPSTPTPALACGTTNFVYDEGHHQWNPKNHGGRLFLAEGMISMEYSPTDILVFDGNILHGVTPMRPLRDDQAQQQYNRFSIIMFSRYGRSRQMKKHGWNRK
jgi:hypothetical protein